MSDNHADPLTLLVELRSTAVKLADGLRNVPKEVMPHVT